MNNLTKEQVAAALAETGVLMELRGENGFRCNAYHSAARNLEQLDGDIESLLANGGLDSVRGIGATLKTAIELLAATGTFPLLADLRSSTPPGLLQMLRIGGLGPKKILVLSQTGITTVDELRKACQDNRVAGLKGFGAKTQTKILEGLEFLDRTGSRIRIDVADRLIEPMIAFVRSLPGVKQAEACGSLRRRKETIGDLDILASATNPGPILDAFVKQPSVIQVAAHGDTLASIMIASKGDQLIRADLRVVAPEQYPFALHYFTGSKEHNTAIRGRAKVLGARLNEYSLIGPDGPIHCGTEAEVFAALGLDWIPPELREDIGEIEQAEKHALPTLVVVQDICGVFHNHTTASDGADSLERMAEAAQELGFQYLGIADHSQSLGVARGLSPERVREQQSQIDALNKRFTSFRLFKGTECDILTDGSLDFDDELLRTFDYVVASVHTNFQLPRDEQTARIVRAIRHPAVTMLGHSTGRLLLQRDGYSVDLDLVLRAAAESGTMIEINAQPKRLDLDWIHARRAKAMGIRLVINPDAHATGELALYRYGVDVARRGGLSASDVFNTSDTDTVVQQLAARRQRW